MLGLDQTVASSACRWRGARASVSTPPPPMSLLSLLLSNCIGIAGGGASTFDNNRWQFDHGSLDWRGRSNMCALRDRTSRFSLGKGSRFAATGTGGFEQCSSDGGSCRTRSLCRRGGNRRLDGGGAAIASRRRHGRDRLICTRLSQCSRSKRGARRRGGGGGGGVGVGRERAAVARRGGPIGCLTTRCC
jgi:hypothetical protein